MFTEPRLMKLTYRLTVKHAGTLKKGDQLNVQTPKGIRRIVIAEIDPENKDTNPNIQYKFLHEVIV